MKFNPRAFNKDTRLIPYENWDGPTLCYTYDFIEAIRSKVDLEDCPVIFDIGSRDACQALELSDWFPESEIHIFEPVPQSAEWCRKNVEKWSRPNCRVHQLALSDATGIQQFNIVNNGNIGASSLLLPNVDHPEGRGYSTTLTNVHTKTAKRFMGENGIDRVDLIWMDVQGAEFPVLQGFQEHLLRVKAIHTEVGVQQVYEGAITEDQLTVWMDANDFEVAARIENRKGFEVDLVFVNKRWIS